MLSQQELIDAIKAGDDSRLADLIRGSTDVAKLLRSPITVPRPTNHAIGRGLTLLQLASLRTWKGGSPAAVLIEHGAEVDLHSACGLGMTGRIDELLDADPAAFDTPAGGYVPLQFAISGPQPEVVTLLCKRGDSPNRFLAKVAYFGWEDDVAGQDVTPWRPLHMAALWCFDAGRLPVVDALLDAGGDRDAASPLDGFRPLHLAAMAGRVDLIERLIRRGVDVDSLTAPAASVRTSAQDAGPIIGPGHTPLMVAAAEGFPDATARLLRCGANPAVHNPAAETAADLARRAFWPGQPYDRVLALLRSGSA